MEILTSPWLWAVVILSVGIPALFIAGVRFVAYRMVGRPGTLSTPASEAFPIPTIRFASRWQALRTLLLMLVMGTGTGIILLRFVYGIGAVTNLSDQFPWGLWISFDVMSGVALAAERRVLHHHVRPRRRPGGRCVRHRRHRARFST